MDLDLGLDSILFMGWVGFQICEILWIRIWVRIQYCSWVGSDFKPVKSYGFGFGFGFNIVYGLGRIMDLFFFTDLDLDLDSFFYSNPNPNP